MRYVADAERLCAEQHTGNAHFCLANVGRQRNTIGSAEGFTQLGLSHGGELTECVQRRWIVDVLLNGATDSGHGLLLLRREGGRRGQARVLLMKICCDQRQQFSHLAFVVKAGSFAGEQFAFELGEKPGDFGGIVVLSLEK